MSGGHFDYKQYNIECIADSIEQIIRDNDSNETNDWGDIVGRHYRKDTIEAMKRGVYLLRQAGIYAQRADWLLSCDDGEDCFHSRLAEDMNKLEESHNV
jgi:hypothetical protein